MRSSSLLLILGILIFCIKVVSCQESSHMEKLKAIKDKIFKDYDKSIRPINDTGNATHVKFIFVPKYIVDLDEDKSLFTLDSYYHMYWLDTRIKWSMEETNIEFIQIPIDMIWKPDLSIRNSHMTKVDPYEEVMAYISHDGEVNWFTPATTGTYCAVADADEVTCDLEIGSWSYDGFEMNLDIRNDGGIEMHSFENVNPRWELKEEDVIADRKVYNYSAEYMFLSVRAFFPMVRRPSPQLQLVRTPCILAAVLVLALLCVPPQQLAARILLGSFLFIVLNVLMIYASATAKTLQTGKSAVALVRSAMIVLTMFLSVQILSMHLSYCNGPCRPNATLVRWLSTPLAKRAFFWKRTDSIDRILLKEGDEIEPSTQDEWALVAAAIDRILLLICLPTMSILLLVD